MNKKIMKIWVAALRSGEYQQGNCVLNLNNASFCCLGVLCDLAVKNGLAVKVEIKNNGIYQYDGNDGSLPYSVMNWVGINNHMGMFKGNSIPALYSLNDSGQYSFSQIADIIEKNYELL